MIKIRKSLNPTAWEEKVHTNSAPNWHNRLQTKNIHQTDKQKRSSQAKKQFSAPNIASVYAKQSIQIQCAKHSISVCAKQSIKNHRNMYEAHVCERRTPGPRETTRIPRTTKLFCFVADLQWAILTFGTPREPLKDGESFENQAYRPGSLFCSGR